MNTLTSPFPAARWGRAPEDYGDYFAWGETEKILYANENCPISGLSYSEL